MDHRPPGIHPLPLLQPLIAVNGPDYTVVNPLDDPDWDTRVLSSGSQCVFHSQAWARVLAESYQHRPLYLTRSCTRPFDVLIPVMHVESWATGRRGVSLPFSDFCDWLAPPGEYDKIISLLHNQAEQHRWNYLEIRTPLPAPNNALPHDSLYHHELDLSPSAETLWHGLKSEIRTAIRKSESAGIAVRFTHSYSDFMEFIRLHALTRRKLGIPPQPTRFFERFFYHIISSGLGEIGIAHKEGVSHAAAIFMYFGNTALYKYGASDPAHLTHRGNDALMWAAILKSANNGFTRLSMGRTAHTHEGLRRFKLGWGCRESPLDYFRYDYQLKQFTQGRPRSLSNFTKLLKHMPLQLLQLTGRLIYPHLS